MKNVLIGAILSLTSLSTFAADSNFSGEILIGTTDQKAKSDYEDIKGDDTSFGLRGAYKLNENIAFELSYNDYGEADDSYIDESDDAITDSITTTSINFGLKGILPLDNGFSLHARIGLALWDVELEQTDTGYPGEKFKGDDSGNDFYYGIGAQILVSEKLSLGAEYTISEFAINPDSYYEGLNADIEVKTFSLTASLKF